MIQCKWACLLGGGLLVVLSWLGSGVVRTAEPEDSPKTMAAQGTEAEGTPKVVPPVRYELVIDGESFVVEANKPNRLDRPGKPGQAYQVQLRLTPKQRLRLNTLQIEYDSTANVTDDHRSGTRTADVQHESGYRIILTDLGQALESADQGKALSLAAEPILASLKKAEAKDVKRHEPHTIKLAGCQGRGLRVDFRDNEGFAQTYLVYVLSGEKFGCSCLIHFFDLQRQAAIAPIKAILESIGPVPDA